MVRTRDFVLVLLMIAFVVVTISMTELWQKLESTTTTLFSFTETTPTKMEGAEVPTLPSTRDERLATLRDKVATVLTTASPLPPTEPVTPKATTTPVTADATTTPPVPVQCSNYQNLTIAWSAQSIQQENREGMRVYFELEPTLTAPEAVEERIRVRLPLRFWPLSQESCIASDVIGIALDGSLIRNNEVSLYAVFGADTLIGYTLDGYPLYGANGSIVTDTCGGSTVDGTYRYYISPERETILRCYSGVPVTIN